MPPTIPNARAAARKEAEQIRRLGFDPYTRGIERVLRDAPRADPATLLDGLEKFHQERLAKVPSPSIYPESPPWVEYVLGVEGELQRLLNLTPRQLAARSSLWLYLAFRGFVHAKPRPVTVEKCRVVYIPATDHGRMHYKNVDDPAPPRWNPPRRRPPEMPAGEDLVWDGTGSGLHIDDEPAELFPLPIPDMYRQYAEDVPGAVSFLTKYAPFFGGQNFVLHDKQGRSAAIEKCSHKFIEVFPPDPATGFAHCSGMCCRNPQSPQGKHQRAKRDQYLKLFGLPADGTDQTFWDACDKAERMLAEGVRAMGKTPKRDEVFKLFTTPWPNGLNKPGTKLHPEQSVAEYTLVSHGTMLDERIYYRWQRDKALRFPAKPEMYRY